MRYVTGTAMMLAIAATLAVGEQPVEAASKDKIVFEVTGLSSSKGQVFCALHTKGDWMDSDNAVAGTQADIEDGEATCVFEGPQAGTYALAAYHDQNDNKELDTNWLGIPSEGVCTGKATTPTMGPPKFKNAKFEYSGGVKTLSSEIMY